MGKNILSMITRKSEEVRRGITSIDGSISDVLECVESTAEELNVNASLTDRIKDRVKEIGKEGVEFGAQRVLWMAGKFILGTLLGITIP